MTKVARLTLVPHRTTFERMKTYAIKRSILVAVPMLFAVAFFSLPVWHGSDAQALPPNKGPFTADPIERNIVDGNGGPSWEDSSDLTMGMHDILKLNNTTETDAELFRTGTSIFNAKSFKIEAGTSATGICNYAGFSNIFLAGVAFAVTCE